MISKAPHRRKNRTFKAASVALACSVSATASHAQEGWDYTGLFYLWGAGLGGETTTGQDVDVGFSDILENLDFGIMGTLEARNGRWSIFGDAIYLNVASDDDATAGPGIPVSVAAEVEGFVFTTGVGYDFAQTNSSRLNGFAGLRYLDMDTEVNLAVAGGSSRVNDKFSNWDGIIGLRGQSALSPDWDLLYYADVGTGDSDLTWQVALAMDYKFDAWTLTFGYRHLDWSGLNDSATLEDLKFSGPFVGAKFNF